MPGNSPDGILWTANEAAQATRGTPMADWAATGVSIDSRSVVRGDLFIALQGENFDGHDYAIDALSKGAAAIIVSKMPQGLPDDAPVLVVDDTHQALKDLAQVARHRCSGRIIGVTGSVGKTGTKEALRLCLGAQAPSYATVGNLNNEIGAPLSLTRMPTETHFGIFELGMNHAGEIHGLSRMVRPDIAIITTVDAVHIEHFANVEGIADAKAEIFDGMGPNGTAILNRDNPHYARLLAHARTKGLGTVLSFGRNRGEDAYIIDARCHATSSAVTAVVGGERLVYSLSIPGEHWVLNSLAVLLAAKAAGADVPTAARALAYLRPMKGRGTRSRISTPYGSFLLIDESYNASPASMRAALSVLDKTDPPPGGRRVAVLGDMLELGEYGPELHEGLMDAIHRAGIDVVHCAGPLMQHLYEKLPGSLRGHWAPNAHSLATIVANETRPGDVVMVKGSHGSRMTAVIEELTALSAEEPDFDVSTALAANDA
jgi:UDP-N-acetylmuramoyl-tripeptide--D-alanyl-D-alanine ligase